MYQQSEIKDKNIKLAIALKVHELQRTQLSSLTYQHVESTLMDRWKLRKPDSLQDAVNDIMHLTAGEVVAFLSSQAIIMGSRMKLNDFDDLFDEDEEDEDDFED